MGAGKRLMGHEVALAPERVVVVVLLGQALIHRCSSWLLVEAQEEVHLTLQGGRRKKMEVAAIGVGIVVEEETFYLERTRKQMRSVCSSRTNVQNMFHFFVG
jgi:hypothetical protein